MIRSLLKSSSVAGKPPATSDLIQRELALNTADAKLYALNAAGQVVMLNPTDEPVYYGGTLYRDTATARCQGSAVTDANGRVTLNITKDGTSTGAAIFTSIKSVQACAVATGTTNTNSYPYATIESVTAKVVTVRLLMGQNILVGGNPMAFAGAGVTVYIDVQGLT